MCRRLTGVIVFAASAALAAALCMGGPGAFAEQATREVAGWTQWRGPSREGSVAVPDGGFTWPEQAVLLWEREIGEGYSGPLVSGNRVWVHSRVGRDEVVTCLTLSQGESRWVARYSAPFSQHSSGRDHGKGPYSTPALADGRLFTLGVTTILSTWDAESGDLLWRKDYSEEFEHDYPFFGCATSPLIWDDLCFVHFGGMGREEPVDSAGGAMVALRVRDGSEEWRWEEDGPSVGASPVIQEIHGQWQLVFKTFEHLVGLDPRSGKELWRMDYRVSQYNTIVTPLFLGDLLVTSDYDEGMGAWQVAPNGGAWTVRQVWKTRGASLFTSSPVMAGGVIVGFSHFRKGEVFGLDSADGRVLWREEPRSGEHASLISRGDQVLVFLEDGSLQVAEVSRDSYHLLRKYQLTDSRVWAHPAIAGNRMLVRSGGCLSAFLFESSVIHPR